MRAVVGVAVELRWSWLRLMDVRALLLLVLLVATGCAGAGSTTSGSATSGTITGTVLRAPMCPVERVGSACPPGPVAGGEVDALSATKVVARATTDGNGGFRLTVRPGAYTVVAYNSGGLRTSVRTNVTVAAGGMSHVTLTVDSGIR